MYIKGTKLVHLHSFSLMSYVDRTLIVIIIQIDSTSIRGTTTVIEKAPERKLEETVKLLRIVQQLVGFVGIRGLGVAQLVRIHGVEVARVGRVLDTRYVRRCLTSQSLLEVYAREERVTLDLVRVLT